MSRGAGDLGDEHAGSPAAVGPKEARDAFGTELLDTAFDALGREPEDAHDVALPASALTDQLGSRHLLGGQAGQTALAESETIYRDARRVVQELQEGQRERLTLERRNQELEAENVRLRQQAGANPFEDQDKVSEFAATAQAEGVSPLSPSGY